MSEIIERVARAMGAVADKHAAGEGCDDVGVLDADLLLDMAAEAIAAMREPTEWLIPTSEGQEIMALRRPAYVAACRQTSCAGRGFDETNCGHCAYCADIADDIIETHSKSVIDAALKSHTKPA